MSTTNPIIFWYKKMKRELYAYYYILTDPLTPNQYKILPVMIFLIYLISPFDLLPDMIPFLGYVDDSIFLMLGLGFMSQLIPEEILKRNRKKADEKIESSYVLEWILLILILFGIALGITIFILIKNLFTI